MVVFVYENQTILQYQIVAELRTTIMSNKIKLSSDLLKTGMIIKIEKSNSFWVYSLNDDFAISISNPVYLIKSSDSMLIVAIVENVWIQNQLSYYKRIDVLTKDGLGRIWTKYKTHMNDYEDEHQIVFEVKT